MVYPSAEDSILTMAQRVPSPPQVTISVDVGSEARRELERVRQSVEEHQRQAKALAASNPYSITRPETMSQVVGSAMGEKVLSPAETAKLEAQLRLDKEELNAIVALLKERRNTPPEKRVELIRTRLRAFQARGLFIGDHEKPFKSLLTIDTLALQ